MFAGTVILAFILKVETCVALADVMTIEKLPACVSFFNGMPTG
jgi:hypothetical protein